MAKSPELQWTTEDRRQLYAILKANVDEGKLDWNSLLRQALGKGATSKHFLENFRTGRIAVVHTTRIYDCLKTSHPQIADEFEAAFHSPPAWEAFVLRHRMLGSLELKGNGFQYYSRMAAPDIAALSRTVIVMDYPALVEFYLDQRVHSVDCAIALYAAGYQWFPMLLQPMKTRKRGGMKMHLPAGPKALITPARVGQHEIQSSALWDTDYPATLIRFVMIVSQRPLLAELSANWTPGKQIPGSELNRYPEQLATTSTPWALHQINTVLLPRPKK